MVCVSMSENNDIFLQNIAYLSSLAQFNQERGQLVLRFYDISIRKGTLFRQKIRLEDIKKFCIDEEEEKKKSRNVKQEIMDATILTLPRDVHVGWNLSYIAERYNYLENLFYEQYGFHITSLALMEKAIREIVYSKADFLGILDDTYKFKNKKEYADLCFLADPSKVFKIKWSACITLTEDEILEHYSRNLSYFDLFFKLISASQWRMKSEDVLEKLRLKEAKNILRYLSKDSSYEKNIPFSFFFNPLIRVHDGDVNKTSYVVPFPFLLGSTTQIRIENSIQNSAKLRKAEEKSKGKIVEFLVNRILSSFPNRNMIKSFRYKVGAKICETDILFLLKNSLWIVEVKSHSIFKKIPLQIEKIIKIFVDKVNEGLRQGNRTIRYLSSEKKFLFNLSCEKKFESLTKGVIIVLDGFVPTLLTQNHRFDKMLGTDEVYAKQTEPLRIYVITLLDLYILSMQPDKEKFEDFLIWRTNHLGSFPVVSYNEREYWSFYNDRYIKMKKLKELFPKLIENDMSVFYISARFNVKDYLQKLTRKDKK